LLCDLDYLKTSSFLNQQVNYNIVSLYLNIPAVVDPKRKGGTMKTAASQTSRLSKKALFVLLAFFSVPSLLKGKPFSPVIEVYRLRPRTEWL